MMTLNAIADWLAGLLPGVTVYCGSINANDSQCIGVYDRIDAIRKQAIGGEMSHQDYPCRILVHWTKNIASCETQALAIQNILLANRKATIDGHAVIDIQLTRPTPVNLGRDDNGIWESAIPMTIIYEV